MTESAITKFLLKYGICQLLLVHLCSSGTYVGESCSDGSGGVGTCKMFLDCPSASLALRDGGGTLKHCGFRGRDPIVCCPDVQPTTPIQEPSSMLSFSKPGEKAQYWCGEYHNICPVSLLGGSLAEIKEFPHMAAIGYGPKERIIWGCGGSLISDKFVMTAAHCLRSETGPPKWVLLGTEVARSFTDSTSPYGRRGQTHPIVRAIRHPEYKPPSKYHDLALLEISPNTLEVNPLELNTRELHPACLPTGWTSNPRKIIATGWGRVGFGEQTSPDLLKVDLDIIDSALCNKAYDVEIKTTKQLTRGIDDSMLCAGVLEGGKDTCQGDSGGPLQVPVKETCLYEVWGITSFGKICGLANSPAVYMKVSAYVPWIESIVWP